MPNKIDIYDEHNQPLGKTLTINQALVSNYWCRGVHYVILSREGRVVMQKRSKLMVMHPNLLDISGGGFVDAGEEPIQAVIREIAEEVGLSIRSEQLELVTVFRHNHYWPKLHKKNRAFIYLYLVVLSEEFPLSAQPEEVAWTRWIPVQNVRSLIRRRRIASLGRLEPQMRLYRRIITEIDKRLSN